MSSSTVKYLSKFRWLLLVSFSSVILMFLFKELNLISNTPSIFERLLRRQASAPTTNIRNDEHRLPLRIGALKSLIELITGLPSSLSETRPNWNYCSKRRKSLDERNHQNVIKRKLKIAITRPTDTFSLDLETSILPNKKKKEKSKTKSEVGKVTNSESAARPDAGGNQSPSGATSNETDKRRPDSVLKVPVKTSYVNQSSSEKVSSSVVDKNSRTASAASTSTITLDSAAPEQSVSVLSDSEKLKAINSTKINQNNLIKSKKLEEEVAGMIDVSSIKAIDFTLKNTVNIKSTNTTIETNDGIQGTKSLETDLFFMYDLDEEFWWRWPKPETDCR
jgi:hypothetical protein